MPTDSVLKFNSAGTGSGSGLSIGFGSGLGLLPPAEPGQAVNKRAKSAKESSEKLEKELYDIVDGYKKKTKTC